MDAFGWMQALGNNLRYAARGLRRSPGFAAVAILTLALGIGANVAAFMVVRAVLLNPLPFPHPKQLVRVFDDLRGSDSRDVGMSAPELWDLRDKSDVFQDLSAVFASDANLTGSEHLKHMVLLATTANYFKMLAARPQIGRLYTQNDERPGWIEGVVLSDGFWRRTFGGDPNAIGRKIRLDSDLYTIIGVMPPEFRHPGRSSTGEVGSDGPVGHSLTIVRE
jgi:putative ABC transport system permease protein